MDNGKNGFVIQCEMVNGSIFVQFVKMTAIGKIMYVAKNINIALIVELKWRMGRGMTAFDHYAKALRFAFEHTEKSRATKERNLRRRHRSQTEINWRLRCAKDRVRLRVFKIHSRQLFKEIERMTDEAMEREILKQLTNFTSFKDV